MDCAVHHLADRMAWRSYDIPCRGRLDSPAARPCAGVAGGALCGGGDTSGLKAVTPLARFSDFQGDFLSGTRKLS